MKLLLKLLFLITITLLPGCTSVKVVDYTADVQAQTFTAYKTFNVFKLIVKGKEGPNFKANFELCKSAIASQMKSRGFTEVDDSGDLSINIGIMLSTSEPGKDEMQYASEPDYSWLVRPKTKERPTVGTITIELVDAAKRSGLWSGSFSGSISAGEAGKQKKINQGIDLLFEKFPVKPKSK